MDRRDFLLASGLAATSEFLSWPPTAALAQEGASVVVNGTVAWEAGRDSIERAGCALRHG